MGDYGKVPVLVTNDDGIFAPGLTELVLKLAEICEVYVCSPDRERSANSHCITLENAIDVTPASVPGAKQSFAVSGTPADCVMLALSGPVFSPQVAGSIRLVISGINRGHNAGLHVVYSGTVAAAREAANVGVPAIAVSLDTFDKGADYKPAVAIVASLVHELLDFGDLSFIRGYVLNVNVPNRRREEMRGFLVTHQSTECTQPRFVDSPIPEGDQRSGKRSFRNVGGGLREDRPRGSDAWALAQGFVAVSFLGSLSAVQPPASVAIGPQAAGERPASLNATSTAAVGRLIGDLETIRRHVDTAGRAKRDNFSLDDALGFDAAGEVLMEASASVGDLYKHGCRPSQTSGLQAHGSNGSLAPGSVGKVMGIFESALGFLSSPSQWSSKMTNSCGAPPSPSGSFRSADGSRGGTPRASATGQFASGPQRQASFEQAVAGMGGDHRGGAGNGNGNGNGVGFPFGDGGGNRGGAAEGLPKGRGSGAPPGSPLRAGRGQSGAGGAGAPSGMSSPLGNAPPGASFGGFSATKQERPEGLFGGGGSPGFRANPRGIPGAVESGVPDPRWPPFGNEGAAQPQAEGIHFLDRNQQKQQQRSI